MRRTVISTEFNW